MTTNRHFCEVFFNDVRIPQGNLVGTEGGAFKQTMGQLEHERGGIDRLMSNHALYRLALERADTGDPLLRQEIAALEIGYRIGRILVTREVLKQAPAGFSASPQFHVSTRWHLVGFIPAVEAKGIMALTHDPPRPAFARTGIFKHEANAMRTAGWE